MTIRTYSQLCSYTTLEERYDYLTVGGIVGDATFGSERYVNQRFYRSQEWKEVRRYVALRDNGMEMGLDDHPILGPIYVHHMNPLMPKDISEATDNLMNPEFLISVSHKTHNAIHYGDRSQLPWQSVFERKPGDTRLY